MEVEDAETLRPAGPWTICANPGVEPPAFPTNQ